MVWRNHRRADSRRCLRGRAERRCDPGESDQQTDSGLYFEDQHQRWQLQIHGEHQCRAEGHEEIRCAA